MYESVVLDILRIPIFMTPQILECSVWERFVGIVGQNPSVPKSNRLHVVSFWFFFISLRYIP
jgi:hypothetical protein